MWKDIKQSEWMEILKLQKKLDKKILINANIKLKNTITCKFLALHVEISELANEVRSFKFWSRKPPSSKEIICEEYVDGLHFIISLGLSFGFNLEISENLKNVKIDSDINKAFIDLTDKVNIFYKKQDYKVFIELLFYYFKFGEKLGLLFENVYKWYVRKNIINNERQKNKY